jgi:hypothetical protein
MRLSPTPSTMVSSLLEHRRQPQPRPVQSFPAPFSRLLLATDENRDEGAGSWHARVAQSLALRLVSCVEHTASHLHAQPSSVLSGGVRGRSRSHVELTHSKGLRGAPYFVVKARARRVHQVDPHVWILLLQATSQPLSLATSIWQVDCRSHPSARARMVR